MAKEWGKEGEKFGSGDRGEMEKSEIGAGRIGA